MKNLKKIALFSVGILMASAQFVHADTTALSQNWAGYIADGSGYTAVGATWIVPTVSTTLDPSADATWVGIGGVQNSDLIQSGTQAIVQDGQVTYQAWVETLPQELKAIPLSVKPGDLVTVSLNQTVVGEWHLSFKNNTTGGDYETDIAYTSSNSSAEWIQEKPSVEGGGSISLDDFTPVQFTGAYAVDNGARKTISQNNAISISMLNGSRSLLASPSSLNSDGASFTVTRTSGNSSVPQVYSQSSSGYDSQQSLPPWKRNQDLGDATGTRSITIPINGSHHIRISIKRFPGISLQVPTSELQLLQLLQSLMNQVYTR